MKTRAMRSESARDDDGAVDGDQDVGVSESVAKPNAALTVTPSVSRLFHDPDRLNSEHE